MVYRVWYGKKLENEVFFTEKEAAQKFTRMVNACMNGYKWKMFIEE